MASKTARNIKPTRDLTTLRVGAVTLEGPATPESLAKVLSERVQKTVWTQCEKNPEPDTATEKNVSYAFSFLDSRSVFSAA